MINNKLEAGEEVVVIIRKHWLIFTMQALLLCLGGLIPVIAYGFVPTNVLLAIETLNIPDPAFAFAYIVWVLMLWILGFIGWTTYYLDTWVVTTKRIIDIDQKTLFNRQITTLMHDKIQDATVEMNGVLPTLFHFGTLIIHTAGSENPNITIHNAADPQRAKDKILEWQHRVGAEGRKTSP